MEELLLILMDFLFYLLWLFPIYLIVNNGRTSYPETQLWALTFLLISWIGWVFYLMFAPLNKDNDDDDFRPA